MEHLDRPKTIIQWTLGNTCNYHCSYCLDILHRGDHPYPEEELIVETCKDIIEHYDSLDREAVFEFLGGEPTLLEKIPSIGSRLHNYPTKMVLKTNGSASLDWWKETKRYVSKVIISAHQEFCNIAHIKNVVELLRDNEELHPIDVELLFPVTNLDDSWNWGMRYVKSFRERFGIGDLQLLYSNFGRGSDMLLPYTEAQMQQYSKFYDIDIKKFKDKTWDHYHNFYDRIPSNEKGYKDKKCFAGVDTLVIDAKGDVFRGWCSEGGRIGNINEKPVAWPTDFIICSKELCTNNFDRYARKI